MGFVSSTHTRGDKLLSVGTPWKATGGLSPDPFPTPLIDTKFSHGSCCVCITSGDVVCNLPRSADFYLTGRGKLEHTASAWTHLFDTLRESLCICWVTPGLSLGL